MPQLVIQVLEMYGNHCSNSILEYFLMNDLKEVTERLDFTQLPS